MTKDQQQQQGQGRENMGSPGQQQGRNSQQSQQDRGQAREQGGKPQQPGWERSQGGSRQGGTAGGSRSDTTGFLSLSRCTAI